MLVVSVAATGSIAPPRKPPHAGSTTTAVLVPMHIVTSRSSLRKPPVRQDSSMRRLDRSRAAVGGSQDHSGGVEPALGGGQECRSAEAAARAVAAGSCSAGEGHGPAADCLSGRSGESGATALPNAGASQAGPSPPGELQSLETVEGDQTRYLRLVEALADFGARLRARADTLDVPSDRRSCDCW